MASRTPKTRAKGRNGVGDQVVINFDLKDPQERRALEAARLLATKHGRRKQAIVALLSAVYAYYEQTGELLSAQDITASLMGQGSAPGRAPVGFTQAIANTHGLALAAVDVPMPTTQDVPASKRRAGRRYSGAGVEVTTSASKNGKDTLTANFMASMKDLASGFFE